MKLKGSIVEIKSRVNASGDTINTVSLEVFGTNIPNLHALLKLPLNIEITEEERGPFDEKAA